MVYELVVFLGILAAFSTTWGDVQIVLPDLEMKTPRSPIKMNVSQGEFTKKMEMYVNLTRDSRDPRRYFTVYPEVVKGKGSGEELLKFRSEEWGEADGVTLKMLVVGESSVKVYQIKSDGSEALVNTRELSQDGSPLWVDSHLNHLENEYGNSSLLVVKVVCSPKCQVLEPVVNAQSRVPGRFARQLARVGKTDCPPFYTDTYDHYECCRRPMKFVFKETTFQDVYAPPSFDAGTCGGNCHFRIANNHHAALQEIAGRLSNDTELPPICCGGMTYEHLDVVRLNDDDPTILDVGRWSNSRVLTCGCV